MITRSPRSIRSRQSQLHGEPAAIPRLWLRSRAMGRTSEREPLGGSMMAPAIRPPATAARRSRSGRRSRSRRGRRSESRGGRRAARPRRAGGLMNLRSWLSWGLLSVEEDMVLPFSGSADARTPAVAVGAAAATSGVGLEREPRDEGVNRPRLLSEETEPRCFTSSRPSRIGARHLLDSSRYQLPSSNRMAVERLAGPLEHDGAVLGTPRPGHDLVSDALVVERLLHPPAGAELPRRSTAMQASRPLSAS